MPGGFFVAQNLLPFWATRLIIYFFRLHCTPYGFQKNDGRDKLKAEMDAFIAELKTDGTYTDRENGILPFEIPFFVNRYKELT